MNSNCVTVFDVGSSHVTALVGKREEHTVILGAASVPCTGMRKGSIISLECVTNAIHDALDEVERQSGLEIDEARVSICPPTVTSAHGYLEVLLRQGEVRNVEVEKLLSLAESAKGPAGTEILQILLSDFALDDRPGVVNPLGLYGNSLRVEHHSIHAQAAELKNMGRAFQAAGLRISSFGYEPLTAAEGVLTSDEKDLGVLSLCLGASFTHLAWYQHGKPQFLKSIPFGAHHITKDLSIGLRTSLAEAEKIKREMGIKGRDDNTPSASHIARARLSEILGQVAEELQRAKAGCRIKKGVVLSGGGSLLAGLVPFVEETLEMPARLGLPLEPLGLTESVRTPAAATVFGLMSPLFSSKLLRPFFLAPLSKSSGLRNFSKSLIEKLQESFVP
jgi:cell division protein FtsA